MNTSLSVASVSDLQREHKKLIERAKRTGELYLFRRNKPEAVLLSVSSYDNLKGQIEELRALLAVYEGEKEFAAGKTKVLRSLKDLR